MKEFSVWLTSALAVVWFSFVFYMANTSLIQSSGFPIKTGLTEVFMLVMWTRVLIWVNTKQRDFLLSE